MDERGGNTDAADLPSVEKLTGGEDPGGEPVDERNVRIDGDVGGVEVMKRTDALTGLIADNLAVETAVSAVRR